MKAIISRTSAAFRAAYLTLLLLEGALIAWRSVPETGPDEAYHFRRAVQISEGHLLAPRIGRNDWGGKLDARLEEYGRWFDDVRNRGRVVTRSDARAAAAAIKKRVPVGTREFASFPSTASYPPLPYLPAAVGLAASEAIGAAPAQSFLAGRLASLLAYVGLLAVLLAILPFGRLGVLLVLSTPTAIALAASYSADGMTNLIPILFIAVLSRAALARRALSGRQKTTLLALSVALGLLKMTCAVVVLAIFLLPTSAFERRREAMLFAGACLVAAFGTALAWNLAYPFVPGAYWGSGGNPAASLALVFDHPVGAILQLWRNVKTSAWNWWQVAYGCFGSGPAPYLFVFLGWSDVLALAMLCLAPFSEREGRAEWRIFAVLCAVSVSYAAAILLAFLIGFSPPGRVHIEGVQGRYFLLPLALLAFAVSAILRGAPIRRVPEVVILAIYAVVSARIVVALLGAYRPLWH